MWLVTAVKCVSHFSLKTGFLKWKPDYDSAASEYGKAGTCDWSPVPAVCNLEAGW